jgi:hypothetical protein
MKEQTGSVDATPSKRLYLSIIADYDVNKALCELIDNALDIWVISGRPSGLEIQLFLDEEQQKIDVHDNAGGVAEGDLPLIVAPGQTGNVGVQQTIGLFGVGTKRAVVALAQDIRIRTRHDEDTFQVEFDDAWIHNYAEWDIPLFRVSPIPAGSTRIELLRLRKPITKDTISRLHEHLSATYAKFLTTPGISIKLNNNVISPLTFEQWAFPPDYEPTIYTGKVTTSGGGIVQVEATAGLAKESSPAGGEYGVYLYCNDRLIARALKTIDVGFDTGMAGKPHADISLTRAIVSLNGDAQLMPWNSSKSNINPSHEVFQALRPWLVRVISDYSSLSRRTSKFEGGWPDNVFRFTSGSLKRVAISDFPTVKTSYLPPLPEISPRYASVVQRANKDLSKSKPWTKGLYETIIAVDWILKQRFDQRNRIALVLLDSTIEIAFKDFLSNECGTRYSEKRLSEIFNNRIDVHKEIKKYKRISQNIWMKIEHYYDQRCQLLHRRATVTIADKDIDDFRKITELVLRKLFNLRF